MSTPTRGFPDVIDVASTGDLAGSRAHPPEPAPAPTPAPAPLQGRTIIIIPAWNEEAPLPAVLHALHETVPECDVVVISDGSTDGTARVARAAGAAVVELPYNLGIGGALRTGFRYAVRNGYQRGIQFDADGQHDPTQIQHLVDALDTGADMVVGSRFALQGGDYQVGKVRGGAMRLLRFTVRRVTKQPFTDTSSGFRAFSRPVLEFFAETYPSEYMESVEALIMAHREGFTVREVPVHMRERQDGTPSNRNLKLLYHYLRLLLVIGASAGKRRRRRPEATPTPDHGGAP
ncbi:MAG: glycosyltransferase family 2 protein [Acidimicrobiales bacterium]